MRRRTGMSPVLAGGLTLAVALAVVWLGVTKGALPFLGGGYEVRATFTGAATELQKGSPVRIAGVDVGKVTKVEAGPGGTAVATLRLDDDGRPLHRDATMKIRPRLFLEGNFFVDVRPGSASAPELGEGETLPLGQTAVAVQLDEVLRTLQRDTRADLQGTIRGLATALDGGGAEALNRSFDDWRGAFSGTSQVFEALRGERPGDLGRAVDRVGAVSAALAADDRRLASLVTGFGRTVTALAASREDLGASLRALDRTVATARPGLADLRRTLPALETFAAALRPALREGPRTLDAATPFARDTSRLLADDALPGLARDLRPATQSLRRLVPDLDALLGKARPVAACVSKQVVPVLTASVQDGIHTTGDPVWLEFARTGPGLAAAAGSFDANGGMIRYGAGGGENLITTQLPGAETLYSLTAQPLLGARPKYTPNRVPPFRPDAPCEQQQPVDLRAEAAPAPAGQRRIGFTAAQQQASIRKATERLRELGPAKAKRALRRALREGGR